MNEAWKSAALNAVPSCILKYAENAQKSVIDGSHAHTVTFQAPAFRDVFPKRAFLMNDARAGPRRY